MPRLSELQEMDDKQLNESLDSQFYTEAPSKKGEEYNKSSLISFFFSELTSKLFHRVSWTFCWFVMILNVVPKTGGIIAFEVRERNP